MTEKEKMTNQETVGYCLPDQSTRFHEFMRRLFPQAHAEIPPEIESFLNADGEVINFSCSTTLGIVDRLRLIFSGKIRIDSKIVCEKKVGWTKSVAVFYVLPPGRRV